DRLAVLFGQPWLGVERVHLRRAAVHEEEDDAGGLRFEMGRLRGEGILVLLPRGFRTVGAIVEQRRQSQAAEAVGAAQKHLGAGKRTVKVAAVHAVASSN